MKRLLNKITDMLADAALLEMSVDVQTTAEHRSNTASEQSMNSLKRLFKNLEKTLAHAALLEEGVDIVSDRRSRPDEVTLEENLIEVAFAEVADYDDIHKAILRERQSERDISHPDDCQYGDNDMCFV
jgi:hypothetical protein